MPFDNGLPWQQQYDTNTTQSGEITGWEVTTTANPTLLDGRAQSIICHGFLFIFSNASTTCYRTTISSNNEIGTWTSVSTGISSSFNSCEFILVGDKLYALGGIDNSSGHGESSPAVRYATIGTNGSIGSWTSASSMPAGRRHGRIIIVNDRLYYIGGKVIRYIVEFSQSVEDSKAEVFYADIDSGGVTGSWSTSANSLPQGRDRSCVALAGEKIYILGGEYNSNKRSTIYYADISGSSIGTWYTETTYTNSYMTCSDACSVVTNNTLYVIGGENSSGGSDNSYLAHWIGLNEYGGLESPGWSSDVLLEDPLTATAYGTAVALTTKLYIVGGVNNSGAATYLLSASFTGGLSASLPPPKIWLLTC